MCIQHSIQTALRYFSIYNYFNNNKHLLNVEGDFMHNGLAICGIGYDSTIGENEIDLHFKYILFSPDRFLSVEDHKRDIKLIFNPMKYHFLDSDAGYFQLSTLHDEDVVDSVCVCYLLNLFGAGYFYIDIEEINIIEKIIHEKNY